MRSASAQASSASIERVDRVLRRRDAARRSPPCAETMAPSVKRLTSKIWPGASVPSRLDDLVAGGQDRDARLGEHLDVGAADGRERADAARRQQIAGGDDAIAGGDVGAAPADVLAGRRRREDLDRRVRRPCAVSSTITTASAPAGSGAPVAISAQVPRRDR